MQIVFVICIEDDRCICQSNALTYIIVGKGISTGTIGTPQLPSVVKFLVEGPGEFESFTVATLESSPAAQSSLPMS